MKGDSRGENDSEESEENSDDEEEEEDYLTKAINKGIAKETLWNDYKV